jgi:hypothetical protein
MQLISKEAVYFIIIKNHHKSDLTQFYIRTGVGAFEMEQQHANFPIYKYLQTLFDPMYNRK